jgi:general secretion pathway protein D
MALAVLLVLLSGCAAQKAYRKGERELARQDWDQAVLNFSKAVALDPGNSRYTMWLERAKLKSSSEHFEKGVRYLDSRQFELAIAEFQQTIMLNPSHSHAQQELDRAVRLLRDRDAGPSALEQIKERARRKELEPPSIDPRANIPILLGFNEVEVGKIFEAISKASGINFIFDDKVDLQKPMTIDIGNVTLEKALDILMLQTKNFYKVVDEFTLLVAPDTRQKRQEYEDQVIRTFFLSNAETKTVVTLLRALLQSRQIAENDDLNSVTIKDTPAKVAIAERIINANDKSRGEVLIDVELLEIDRTVSKTLGLDLSSKTLSLTFRDGEQSLPINNLQVLRDAGSWTVGVIPSVILNFLKSDSNTKLIAKPQLRVEEGERAEILIGDRVPIPTTSFNTSQTVGGNIVPITSFTYQNVGITLQLEPRVHHNKEVTLMVMVEISQVTGTVSTTAGQEQPIIGTRQVQTVIRLRDGETNMLAGLIQRRDQDAVSGVVGLSEIPGLRRVLGNTTKERSDSDIVITLTPRIIRIPDITEDDLVTLWVGTEENMRLRGPSASAFGTGPFGSGTSVSQGEIEAVETAAEEQPRAGSVSRVSGSDEVDRDREDAAREREAQQSAEDQRELEQDAPNEPGRPGATAGVETEPDGADDRGGDDTGREEPEEEQPPGVAAIQLIPAAAAVSVGDVVTVQVLVSNATNVGSVPFHLRYDKSVLQFQPGAQEGPFMNADGTGTVFLANDVGGGGEVVVGLSRLGASTGASGGGVLATFQFLAVNPGNSGFVFTGASVKDPQARNLPASFNAGQVEVQP